ncbi:hypothetical protein LCGC14_0658620, partial [marine sediment metagenome]
FWVRNIFNLKSCLEFKLYRKLKDWNCKAIVAQLETLYAMILYDYVIEGSVTLFFFNEPEWDLRASMINKKRC